MNAATPAQQELLSRIASEQLSHEDLSPKERATARRIDDGRRGKGFITRAAGRGWSSHTGEHYRLTAAGVAAIATTR